MRDVAYRVRVRLENDEGTLGLAGAVGSVISEMVQKCEAEGILSAGAKIASAHFLSVELINPKPGDLAGDDPEISVGGDDPEDNSSPET